MARKPRKRCTEDGKQIYNTMLKVPLHPTPEQAELFDKTFGCCRYIWNRILADEQEFYAATGEHFLPTPAKYKDEAPFLKEVDSQALANVHQTLRQSFQQFFKEPGRCGYPKFKTKNARKQSYLTFCQYFKSGPTVYLTDDGVRLPKAGIVKATIYRKPLHWWKLKSATVSKSASGNYYCSLLYECVRKAPEEPMPTPENTLGIQYSPSHFCVDSNGHKADPPKWFQQSQEKLAGMQRKLSRMERGSKNYQEQLRKIQKLQEHIANQRMDFIHKESRKIADSWDAVCVRDVDLQKLSQKSKFPYQMESGFGQFRTCLQYKLERQGKHYIPVDEYLTSAKQIRDQGLEKLK